MPSRLHFSIWLALTVLLWGGLLWMQGTPILSLNYLKPFSGVVAANVIGATLLNKFIWAWPIINGLLIKRPDLRGTWKVTFSSSWINPDTGEGAGEFKAFIVIRQTLTSLSFRMVTPESSSQLVSHGFEQHDDGLVRLQGTYRNEPKIELQSTRSKVHYGSFLLHIHGSPPSSLEGHYWTDRRSNGSMFLSDRRKELCDTYQQAAILFGSSE